jgi:hypothetical protein
MSGAEWYLRKAAQCARLARQATDPRRRADYKTEEWRWRQIAEQIEADETDRSGSNVCSAMSAYRFVIRNSDATEIQRLGGMALADDGEALTFGKQVIQDLMRRGAEEYAGWSMEVAQDERAVASIPFNQKE